MNQERTEYIIKILHKVFKDGYRPARHNESYYKLLKNGQYASSMVNCFGHVFNLRNKQFDDYEIAPYKVYSDGYAFPYFMGFMKDAYKFDEATHLMLDFIKETGLTVEECDPNETITDFKSWKIALYFSSSDYHYLLEDTPQQWSGKLGNLNKLEYFSGITPPEKYHNRHLTVSTTYNLYGTYKITNKNADENNIYVKDIEM